MLLLWLCFVLAVCKGQVLTEPRDQPYPLNVPETSRCCAVVDKTNPLKPASVARFTACVNGSSVVRSATTHPKDVVIITYTAPAPGYFGIQDIALFGAFQAGLTLAYAEHNGYTFRLLGPETGSNFQSDDARWNKVRIMQHALDPVHGWARSAKYLVWLDSDAVVLDLGMKMEAIGEAYLEADLIASADIRQGYINSGLLVARNTKWTRKFLQEWWEVADRRVVCDQDAFDLLYTQRIQAAASDGGPAAAAMERNRVRILPRDALNSDPPAMATQKASNQVLHLMGEITPLRASAFSTAMLGVCAAVGGEGGGEGRVERQLGLSRGFLLDAATSVYGQETESLLERAAAAVDAYGGLHDDKKQSSLALFEQLGRSAHHLTDVYHIKGSGSSGSNGGGSEREDKVRREVALRTRVLNLTSVRAEQLGSTGVVMRKALETRTAAAGDSPTVPDAMDVDKGKVRLRELSGEHVAMVKRKAEAGNDLFSALGGDPERQLEVGRSVIATLDELYTLLAPQSQSVALHMKALMKTSLAELDFKRAMAVSQAGTGAAAEASVGAAREGQLEALDRATYMLEEALTLFGQVVHRDKEMALDASNGDSSKAVPNASINREHLTAMQMSAAVQCMTVALTAERTVSRWDKVKGEDGEDVWKSRQNKAGQTAAGNDVDPVTAPQRAAALRTWTKAISKARANTYGLPLGAQYEQLASVLLNAAMCYRDLHSHVAALTLVQEAIAVREDIVASGDTRGAQALQLARDLREDLHQQTSSRAGVGAGAGAVAGEEALPVAHEEEWEVCEEGEAGCQAFYVDEDGFDGDYDESGHHDDDNDDDDDDDDEEEEARELAEIRARYAEQAARWAASQADPAAASTATIDEAAAVAMASEGVGEAGEEGCEYSVDGVIAPVSVTATAAAAATVTATAAAPITVGEMASIRDELRLVQRTVGALLDRLDQL